MELYAHNSETATLQAKGGIMLFSVERQSRFYRGMVLLSPVANNERKRIVCMKVYRYKEGGPYEKDIS